MLLALANPSFTINTGMLTPRLTTNVRPNDRPLNLEPFVVSSESDGWKPPAVPSDPLPVVSKPPAITPPSVGETPIYRKPLFIGIAGFLVGAVATAVAVR